MEVRNPLYMESLEPVKGPKSTAASLPSAPKQE